MTAQGDIIWKAILAFYLSFNVVAAVIGTVPGALAERKHCATLERLHFVLFLVGGLAVLYVLHGEITAAIDPGDAWMADLGVAFVAGLYAGNVTARRLRNIARNPLWAVLIWVPGVNLAFFAALALIPTVPKRNAPPPHTA